MMADNRRGANDDSGAVVDGEIFADPGGRVDVDPRLRMGEFRDEPGQDGDAQLIQAVGCPIMEHGGHARIAGDDFVPVRGGDVLDLGGRELEIVELPGHTPGSIAVLDRSRRALISGDPIQNGRIFMFGPARDLRQYLASLRALQKRIGEFDAIWPAHGSFPISPDQIGKLAIAAERILARQVSWEPYDLHGTTVRAYNAGCATFLMQE